MRIDLSEMVGMREAMSAPTKSSMKIPKTGDCRNAALRATSPPPRDIDSTAGVSTIQHPPGAGTPVKKFFQ